MLAVIFVYYYIIIIIIIKKTISSEVCNLASIHPSPEGLDAPLFEDYMERIPLSLLRFLSVVKSIPLIILYICRLND